MCMSEALFLAWCQQHGITTQGVEPGYVAEGWRGIIATEAISPGKVVMSVPEGLLMSGMSARRDPHLAAVLQHHQLNSHQTLSVHLLHEASKGSSSRWYPYIRQLPPTYTTFMCWPVEAVNALQLQHAQAAATAAAEKSRSEWRGARPALQQLGLSKKWCALSAWHWAASCVYSRTMYHPDDPPCGCLTPLADLHNHASQPPPYTPNVLNSMQQLMHRELQQNLQPAAGDADACRAQAFAVEAGSMGTASLVAAVAEVATEEGQAAGYTKASSTAAGGVTVAPATAASAAAAGGDACYRIHVSPAMPAGGSHDCGSHPTCADGQCHGNSASSLASSTPRSGDAVAACSSVPNSSTELTASIADAGSQDMLWGDGCYDAAASMYTIVARCSYSPGEQVFLSYGLHGNLDLLDLYGFMLSHNPHEEAQLPVELLQQALREVQQQQQQRQQGERKWRRQHHQHKQQRQAPVASVELDVAAAECQIHNNGQPSWQLLKALRLAAASPAELHTQSHLAFSGEAISISSEHTALLALMQACSKQLQQLPTTLEQDEAMLSSMTIDAAASVLDAGQGISRSTNIAADPAAAATGADASSSADCPSRCVSSTGDSLEHVIHSHYKQQRQQADQQQSCARSAAKQQKHEYMLLAVRWRSCYKLILTACIDHCRRAIAVLEGR